MKYVNEFDGLRGLMAVWVLLGHWASTVEASSRLFKSALFNHEAVTVFVILSGFAIAAMNDKKKDGYVLYIQRRVLRIFPVYLLFFLASVLVAPAALETWIAAPDGSMKDVRVQIASDTLVYWPYHLAAHIPALHGLIPPRLLPSTDTAFLGQAWSISLEWQFYLVAPAMIALMIGKWPAAKVAVILVSVSVAMIVSRWMPGGFIGRSLHDFIIGICSYYFLKQRTLGTSTFQAVPVLQAWLAIVTVGLLASPIGALPYIIWATTIAAIVAFRENRSGAPEWLCLLLLSRPFQWVGRMAYSVYLSHMLVLIAGLNLLAALNIESKVIYAIALLAFVLFGTLVVSFASYRLVEMPFHNLGRRLGQKRFRQSPERDGSDAKPPDFANSSRHGATGSTRAPRVQSDEQRTL